MVVEPGLCHDGPARLCARKSCRGPCGRLAGPITGPYRTNYDEWAVLMKVKLRVRKL